MFRIEGGLLVRGWGSVGASVCVAMGWSLLAPPTAGFNFTTVVDTQTQAPSEILGYTYDTFGRPSIHNGTIAYRAAKKTPGLGVRFVDRATPTNTLSHVLKLDYNATSRAVLSDPSTSLGDAAFKVIPVAGGGQPNEYYTTGNTLNFSAIGAGAAQIYDGNVVFSRFAAGNSGKNLFLIGFNANDSNPATFSGVAIDGNDLVPGGAGALFTSFGDYLDHNITKNPLVQNRSIALVGNWFSGTPQLGVYRWDQQPDTITAIADKNVPIPGLGGTFNQGFGFLTTHVENNGFLGDPGMSSENSARPSLYGQTVAFSYDDLATKSGAYVHNNGSVKIVADTNTPHPSQGGTFGRFFEVSTIGGVTAFVATGDSGASLGGEVGMSGLFLQHCGKLIQVLQEGDVLAGVDVTNIQLSHRGLGVGAGSSKNAFMELTFRATLANGTEGIYRTTTSLLCYSLAVGYAGGTATGTSLTGKPLGSSGFEAPVFDESARLAVSMQASYGAGLEGLFGGDMAADLYGVDSLPGNDPTLIDFTLDGGAVVSEAMSLAFNQDVLVHELQLVGFDPLDSALIEVNGEAFVVTGAAFGDGYISLGDRLLNEGASIRVSWDPANSVGDGFSLNNVAFTAVPEPATMWLAAITLLVALRARRQVGS